MAEQTTTIQKMDEALGRYYKLKGRTDYFNEQGIGIFAEFCDDNGMDDEAVDGEFEENADIAGCILLEFDDDPGNVPGIDAIDEEEIQEAVYNILQKCYQEDTAYDDEDEKYNPLTITHDHWNISKKDLEEMIKIHQEQCPSIFNQKFEKDKSILKLLAVGAKCGRPYLQYICDMYSRERVELFSKKNEETLYPQKWTETNKHCSKLRHLKLNTNNAKGKTPLDETQAAIKSFFHRISPKLVFKPPLAIVDSLSQTCEYIAACVDFVHSLVNDDQNAKKGINSCPFQFDCTFAFNQVRDTQSMVVADEDDDDDSADDEDYKAPGGLFYDCFGNIKDKIAKNKLLYLTTKMNTDDVNVSKQARLFKENFKKFISDNKMENKYKSYPQRHRFCAIIDRRQPDDKDNKNKDILDDDELIIYQPPDNCNQFPKGKYEPMFYFDTTRTSIIPQIGYNNGINAESDPSLMTQKDSNKDPKQKALTSNINALNACNGAIMVLSFHVESAEEIRCYVYLNGQILRFMPEDITLVLPKFFDSNFGDNKLWPKSEEAKQLIDEMSKKLKDVHFKAFYNAYKSPKI